MNDSWNGMLSGLLIAAVANLGQLCSAQPLAPVARAPLEEIAAGTPSPREEEIVRERYADGRVHIERHVIRDENDNYVNDGQWTERDPAGAKIMEGQYRRGQPNGLWSRYYRGSENPLFQELPYMQFRAPFVSQASFRSGQLDGSWTIFDSQRRKISEISFTEGQRNGPAVWWYPAGGKMRELTFVDGLLDGPATFYRPTGEVARRETYERGRKRAQHAQKFDNGVVQSEGTFLYPQIVVKTADNFWNCELATFEMQGEGAKIGTWTLYYPTGQKMMTGRYDEDLPVGKFTWWHESGQRSLAGAFAAGRQDGRWIWWHGNGIKMSQGEFRRGEPAGLWAYWNADGVLERRVPITEVDDEALAARPMPQIEELPPARPEELPPGMPSLPVSVKLPETLEQPGS